MDPPSYDSVANEDAWNEQRGNSSAPPAYAIAVKLSTVSCTHGPLSALQSAVCRTSDQHDDVDQWNPDDHPEPSAPLMPSNYSPQRSADCYIGEDDRTRHDDENIVLNPQQLRVSFHSRPASARPPDITQHQQPRSITGSVTLMSSRRASAGRNKPLFSECCRRFCFACFACMCCSPIGVVACLLSGELSIRRFHCNMHALLTNVLHRLDIHGQAEPLIHLHVD